MEKEESIKEIYIKLMDSITDSNQEMLLKLRECLDRPTEYYSNNILKYRERGFEDYTTDKEIFFWTIIDLLVENKYCCELDYKEEVDVFIDSLQNLENVIYFTKENLEYKDDIFIWCDIINKEWKTKKKCIAQIDTNNDSYVLFVIDVEKLNYISTLANSLSFKIIKVSYTKEGMKVYEDKRNEYFTNYYNNKILSINANKRVNFFREKTKSQLWEVFLIIVFVVTFIVSIRIGMINSFYGVILFFSSLVLLFLLRKYYEMMVIFRFYKINNGEKNFNLIKTKNLLKLDELYENDTMIFYEEINAQSLNFIYNWLNNNNFLKDEKVDAYIINGKCLRDKFNVILYNDSQELLCISFNDLNFTSANKNIIFEARQYMKAAFLQESVKRSIEIIEGMQKRRKKEKSRAKKEETI